MGMAPVGVELELRRYTLTLALDGFIGGSLDLIVTEDTNVVSFMMVADPDASPTYFE